MGSVLTPLLTSLEDAAPLPDACTACGRCAEVCPAAIPLPELLRDLRAEKYREGITPARWRIGLGFFSWLACRPWLYRLATRLAVRLMHAFGGRTGVLHRWPLAKGWLSERELPAPESGDTYLGRLRRERKDTGPEAGTTGKTAGGVAP